MWILLLALGGLNRREGSACCPPIVHLSMAGTPELVREGGRRGAQEPTYSCTHTHSCIQTHFPSCFFLLLFFCLRLYLSGSLSISALPFYPFFPPSSWCLLSLQSFPPQPSPCSPNMSAHIYFSLLYCISTGHFLCFGVSRHKYLPCVTNAYSIQYSNRLYRLVAEEQQAESYSLGV